MNQEAKESLVVLLQCLVAGYEQIMPHDKYNIEQMNELLSDLRKEISA